MCEELRVVKCFCTGVIFGTGVSFLFKKLEVYQCYKLNNYNYQGVTAVL